VVMLIFVRQRWHFVLTMIAMVLAIAGVAVHSPRFLTSAFNPVSLNALMFALALVGLLVSRDLPMARRCLRRDAEGKA
jgi:hypothetical protein